MRRGKRVAFSVMATGLGVVVGLGILYRGEISDHIEAWHFQLTRKTQTIEPEDEEKSGYPIEKRLFHRVAEFSLCPLIFAPGELRSGVVNVTLPSGNVKEILHVNGWRLIEQRFPRRASVVIRDELTESSKFTDAQ